MKTVKDVYAMYPGKWPSERDYCYTTGSEWDASSDIIGNLEFTDKGGYKDGRGVLRIDGDLAWVLVCTREEYEAYKAEQEQKVKTKADWYDYEKGEMLELPLANVECEVSNCGNDFVWCRVVFMGNAICLVDHESYNEQHYHLDSVKFRPLDHDKHTAKVAPMDWGVKAGIDFEFKSGGKWYTDKLSSILNGGYITETYAEYTHCRPRMNHKHVLTYDQYNLMPSDVFEFNILHTDLSKDIIIVEFTGLKDGYVWECE